MSTPKEACPIAFGAETSDCGPENRSGMELHMDSIIIIIIIVIIIIVIIIVLVMLYFVQTL